MPASVNKHVIPAEWAPHLVIWTAWPSHPELWEDDLAGARAEVAAMVKTLAASDTLNVLACGDEAVRSAENSIGACARIIAADFGDIWLRDTGPIFTYHGDKSIALRFATNGWGGKYDLPGDNKVGDTIANAAGAEISRFEYVLEGGALEHNGAGVLLTTRQCVLNPNRNPGWTEPLAEQLLQQAFNCQRILWLDNGLLNDHTDGHVDNLARFISTDAVVCQTASGSDDPNAALYETIAQELGAMGLTVHRIPSPGKVSNADGDILPASHMNFIIGNTAVVVPVYDQVYGDAAVRSLQKLFPEHTVTGINSSHLLTGGGSFHCITQQEPTAPDQGH